MKRKIYQELLNWKEKYIEKLLTVIRSREIGKNYIIKEFCDSEFESYIYINLLKQKE